MLVTAQCPFCKAKTSVVVDPLQFENWQTGARIQNAFPTMSAENREILMTGMCLDCQALTFTEDE